MYIDYVRIYQKEGQFSITCDPSKVPLDFALLAGFPNHENSWLPYHIVHQRPPKSIPELEYDCEWKFMVNPAETDDGT
jgi:hypothetical protein